MNTILVVDDEPNYLIVLSELLKEEGFEVMTAQKGEDGLKIAQDTDLDLVITDMRMPGMDGLELLQAIKSYNKDLPVIMITAFGEVEKAVVAMKAGAYNYLAKPFNNEELLLNIRKAIEHYSLLRENLRLRDEARVRYGFASIVGKNPRMQEIYQLIEKVAPTPASVLIFISTAPGRNRPLYLSIVPPCLKTCWKANCSDMNEEPLPELLPCVKAGLSLLTQGHCFLMKLVISNYLCRQNYYGSCRKGVLKG